MTITSRYLIGISSLTVIGAVAVTQVQPPIRGQVVWAAAAGFVLQAPLGWWVVRSIGTERFLAIWGLGILTRFAVLGIAGFGVVPLLGWNPEPTLGTLALVLVALLFVEGITAWREHSGTGAPR